MVDITHKSDSLRKAIAEATVQTGSKNTVDAIRNLTVPKGNVLESARVAALFGVKKTADLIPDCHPLPVEFTSVSFELSETSIRILVEVHTVYKTGVEVEAMHGASIAALTIYDMLKPIDKQVEIQTIRLLQKSGGKSNQLKSFPNYSAGVIVCSDSVFSGTKEDKSGETLCSLLKKLELNVLPKVVVADEVEAIQSAINALKNNGTDVIILTGGTGLSKRDRTPEAVKPLIDTEIPGIVEAARNYGMQRMNKAMLSRSVSGFSGETLLLTFPGSVSGVKEYFAALFPQVMHVFEIRNGEGH